jgi:DNA gyrase/topoisomerase IV subunit B
MDSKELGDTLLDASTRNIVQLTVSDIDKTEQMFEDLYGKSVQPRVDYILNHSENGEVNYE